MNTINEIGLQNQQDFWAQLYLCLGSNIMKRCGRGGERAVREAVHRMAYRKGKALNKECRKAGIKTNLKTLYALSPECSEDPRVRKTILREEEDIRIWEIYTCPMAALWMDASAAKLGRFYCEENQHGLIQGFTIGVGQLNLTKKLTCHRENGCRADDYCRFSAYYRAANTGKVQRGESFSDEAEVQKELPSRLDFRTNMKEKCISTLCSFTETAQEQFFEEGRCAVAAGLRELADNTVKLLLYHAEATQRACDREFVLENLPVDLEIAGDSFWDQDGELDAASLFEVNFLRPLKEGLSIK